MNPRDYDRWRNEMLGEVLLAFAQSDVLRPVLIFKGARILSQRLREGRMSYDLNSTLAESFVLAMASTEARSEFLEREIPLAVESYFANRTVVRFSLEQTKVETIPHALGWDGFRVRLKIRDAEKSEVLGLPLIDLDIGAPEKFSPHAVGDLRVDHHSVRAYTLERIAGEKLRAFLSSLPEYRRKVGSRPTSIRVKDLYDLARILAARPVTDEQFWRMAGEDFRLACEARFIDCSGLDTFIQNWDDTRSAYTSDATLPKDISFAQGEAALAAIVATLGRLGFIRSDFRCPQVLSERSKIAGIRAPNRLKP